MDDMKFPPSESDVQKLIESINPDTRERMTRIVKLIVDDGIPATEQTAIALVLIASFIAAHREAQQKPQVPMAKMGTA